MKSLTLPASTLPQPFCLSIFLTVEYLGIIRNIQICQSLFGACLRDNLKQVSATFDQSYMIFERDMKEIN